MKAELLGCYYVPSDKKIVQGNPKLLKRYLEEGYEILRGGNGTYILGKEAQAIATVKVGEEILEYVNIRELILDYFNGINMSQKRFNEFQKAWEYGMIDVYYSENRGLYT